MNNIKAAGYHSRIAVASLVVLQCAIIGKNQAASATAQLADVTVTARNAVLRARR
jgi:hypothetical protein